MARIEKTIDVDVPVRTAYNQWTQFEEFPRFMEGIEEVRQLDDKRLHWRASIAGKEEEWNAEIIEQTPDTRVVWRSTSGPENSGAVKFEPQGPQKTRVSVIMSYEPEGVVETVGDKIGVFDRRVEGDLQRFKDFIEGRGVATGAWRGEIHGGTVEGESSAL